MKKRFYTRDVKLKAVEMRLAGVSVKNNERIRYQKWVSSLCLILCLILLASWRRVLSVWSTYMVLQNLLIII